MSCDVFTQVQGEGQGIGVAKPTGPRYCCAPSLLDSYRASACPSMSVSRAMSRVFVLYSKYPAITEIPFSKQIPVFLSFPVIISISMSRYSQPSRAREGRYRGRRGPAKYFYVSTISIFQKNTNSKKIKVFRQADIH